MANITEILLTESKTNVFVKCISRTLLDFDYYLSLIFEPHHLCERASLSTALFKETGLHWSSQNLKLSVNFSESDCKMFIKKNLVLQIF